MSQHDFNIANQGFPATRADLNNALAALASNSSGTSEPSTTYAGQFWNDTTNNLLKFRNDANDGWITFAKLDQATNEWEIRSSVFQAVDSAGIAFKTDDGTTRATLGDDGNWVFTGGATFSGSLASSNISSVGALSNRNLIINGAMQVAQRGTSVAGVTSGGYRTCDRMEVNVSNLGTYTVTQESDAPEGFVNSLKINCTVADASPASSDYVFFAHKLEGQDLQHLKKGTSNALPVTLSFWVKSNMTGTYQFNLRDNDNVRYISASYTIDVSGTWEYKTITLVGDTTGAPDNDANESLKLEWWLDSGSDFDSGALNTSWAAANNVNRNAATTVNIGDSTSNYFQITGVQLEVGDTATPFEHRSYGDELQRCQRYFQSFGNGPYTCMCYGSAVTAGVGNYLLNNIVPMRAIPSVSYNNIQHSDGANAYELTSLVIATVQSDENNTVLSGGQGGNSLTQFRPIRLEASNNAAGRIKLDAEL